MKKIFKISLIIILGGIGTFGIFIGYLFFSLESNYDNYVSKLHSMKNLSNEQLYLLLISEEDACIRYEILKKLKFIEDNDKEYGRKYCDFIYSK